jgi:S-adenosylmethionine:tRNA-ribosyltransferase-isomerase (queuine synthetase)
MTIKATIIIEMMGRPVEHLKETFNEYLNKMSEDDLLVINSKKVYEPKKIEESKEMYSCFAEIEIEVQKPINLLDVVFRYMPASVEITEPSEINFPLFEANEIFNALSGKLHKYDEIAKISQIQSQRLAKKLQEVIHEKTLLEEEKDKK